MASLDLSGTLKTLQGERAQIHKDTHQAGQSNRRDPGTGWNRADSERAS